MRKKEYPDKERKIEEELQKGNLKKASDICITLAQDLRRNDQIDESITTFKDGLVIARDAEVRADEILALRGLAEIYCEKGDVKGLEFLATYEELVKRGDPVEYQLMLTVGCYCYVKLYTEDDNNGRHLEKAKEMAERSLEMIDSIDCDKKMDEGDSITIRKINCHRYLAEIAGYQGNRSEGEKHYQLAFASAEGRKEFQFEILRTRIDFPWRDKVGSSEDLCKFADSSMRSKRVEAYIFLAIACFERQLIPKGTQALFSINADASNTRKSSVHEDDKEKYSGMLVFAYIASERLRKLHKYKEENNQAGQFGMHDKLADLYLGAGFKKASLDHYRKSLSLAETQKKKRDALISLAETCSDLKMYKEATEYFARIITIEENMGKDTDETVASLFQMRLLDSQFHSDSDVEMEIDKLERKMNKFMNAIYDAAAKYYAMKGNREEMSRHRKNEEHFNKVAPKIDVIDDKEEEDNDSLDEMDDIEILQIMRKRACEAAKLKTLTKSMRKKNHKGEHKLTERCREGTLEEVKTLIQHGSNVNESCEGGWTPLSEAVSANKLDIVKYLLSKGADPNSKSIKGWYGQDFGGGLTPLMEACADGRLEIATWLLQHASVKDLVVATNQDGWSAADFMTNFIKRAYRDEESEKELQDHLNACKKLLERIKQLQRINGYPVRCGEPPMPRKKSDDTEKYALEKRRIMARMNETSGKLREKAATDEYKEAMTSIGSRSKQDDKKKRDRDDDLFDMSDDEPLIPSSSSVKKKRVILSSGSEDDDDIEKENEKKNGRRKGLDEDDSMFGLEMDDITMPSLSMSSTRSSTPVSKMSGVHRMLQKTRKGRKRSSMGGGEDENGISVVPDDFEIEERIEPKRRRNDSESSQSESGVAAIDRLHSLHNMIDGEEQRERSENVSPAHVLHRANSRASLSSASGLATTWVRVIIEKCGMEPDEEPEKVRSKVPSEIEIVDLPNHIEKVRRAIDGGNCVWTFQGDTLESATIGDLVEMTSPDEKTGQRMVELHCRISKTLKGELERRADPSDDLSALSSVLSALEASRSPKLELNGSGSSYTEKTRDGLWRVIEEFVVEKTKEDGKWRVERIEIENINVPVSALRALLKMRPREGLFLRYCGLDDNKVEEMAEEMSRSGEWRLDSIDLSFNDLIGSSEMLAKLVSTFRGVRTIILKGLSGIEEGMELMSTLRRMSLICLNLNENPWMDDSCMKELMNGEEEGESLTSLKQLYIAKCAIRTMTWMGNGLESIKILSLAENSVTPSGWERVGGFMRSGGSSLTTIDVRGTSVRSVILEALAVRSPDAPSLTLSVSRCNGITPSEICRVLSPLVEGVNGQRGTLNIKIQLEREKVEEVRRIAPNLAAKALKVAPEGAK